MLPLLSLLLVGSTLNTGPDARSFVRGADAVHVDAAAVGLSKTWELQVRGNIDTQDAGRAQTGLYAVLPALGPVRLFGGYEWLNVPGTKFRRGTFGLAVQLSRRLSIGARYFALDSSNPQYDGKGSWDIGAVLEPRSWLSLSVSGTNLSRRRIGGEVVDPSFRLGASVRPVRGNTWLTFGGETELFEGDEVYDLTQARLFLDAGAGGIHGVVAYEFDPDRVWFGLSLDFDHVRARTLGAVADSDFNQASYALTVRPKGPESVWRPKNRTVQTKLAGDLQPRPTSIFVGGPAVSSVGLRLRRAAEDNTIGTVILSIDRLAVGMATVEDLRARIHELRQRGKRVIARLGSASEKEYLVAAACDEIHMDPETTLVLDGFTITQFFFKDALAQLGVRFDSVEIGSYKSGPDPLTKTKPRKQDEEVLGGILDAAMRRFRQVLRDDRGFDAKTIDAVLSDAAFPAEEAVHRKLVDKLTQPSRPQETPTLYRRHPPLPRVNARTARWSQDPIIAVVSIQGVIAQRRGDNPLPGATAGALRIVQELDRLREDSDVRAVVLRIDSPGGDVFASELVWRAARALRERKPVVVSMGDVAASGGYYVATAGHRIFAQPQTITGSIGIFTLKPDIKGLLEWAKIYPHSIKRGELAGWESITEPLSDEARARIRKALTAHYDHFIEKVAFGRGMSEERARSLAEGKVYTGAQALELELIDAFGGLEDAIDEAKRLAGVDVAYEVAVSEAPGRLGQLIEQFSAAPLSPVQTLQAWREQLIHLQGKPLALMPYLLEVSP